RGQYNQSKSLHMLQRLSGCDLLSDGRVRRTLWSGYNAWEFLSFALETGSFVVADGTTQITQRCWKSEGCEALLRGLGQTCAE
ncbi:HA1B protein, partial [Rhagologus leucostigma]|nr:HA1B protein [Rhagologus leucostigma]